MSLSLYYLMGLIVLKDLIFYMFTITIVLQYILIVDVATVVYHSIQHPTSRSLSLSGSLIYQYFITVNRGTRIVCQRTLRNEVNILSKQLPEVFKHSKET